MPDLGRGFRITYGFPSAVPGPPRGLQRQQSGRLCQQVRDMVAYIGCRYLAKQGAGGGEEGEHKSLWIPLYSGWDRWAVISLHGTNYRVSRPPDACGLLASFHSLEHHFHTGCVGPGHKQIWLQVRASLAPWAALSMFYGIFKWKGWNRRVPLWKHCLERKGQLRRGRREGKALVVLRVMLGSRGSAD